MKKIILIAVIIVGLVIAGLAVHFIFHGGHGVKGSHEHQEARYHCPMHPDFVSDKPGECPICGMDLVPMETKGDADEHGGVVIPAERQRLAGIETSAIVLGKAEKTIRAVGQVAFDPELAIAQREYVESLKLGDEKLTEAARQRLTLMGIGADRIKEIAKTGKVEKGLYLPDQTAWVYPVVYEYELPFVTVGQAVTIELPSGKGEREGKILSIDPVVDGTARTARLHVEVQNKDGLLRPNMFVNAVITSDLGEKLLVPKSAVIDSGERKVVFVVHDETHFIQHEVVLSAELADKYVVESGLKAGDEVVTSSTFLIDAESKLKTATGEMSGHKHGE